MVEKHWLGDKLIKSFEFKFPFCIPSSRNTAEFIYDLPEFTEEDKMKLLMEPWSVTSDSYFFNDDKLIVHNKAKYNYAKLE